MLKQNVTLVKAEDWNLEWSCIVIQFIEEECGSLVRALTKILEASRFIQFSLTLKQLLVWWSNIFLRGIREYSKKKVAVTIKVSTGINILVEVSWMWLFTLHYRALSSPTKAMYKSSSSSSSFSCRAGDFKLSPAATVLEHSWKLLLVYHDIQIPK